MLLLSTCLIINLEEFDGVSSNRLADLKRIITQEKITERKVYDTQSHTFIRHASFAASTNNPRCLQDIGENRRMLFNSIKSIDYRRPVNHEGIYSQALALYRQGFRFWPRRKTAYAPGNSSYRLHYLRQTGSTSPPGSGRY